MKGLVKGYGLEALVGLVVVAVAAWFIAFAWQRTGGGVSDAIEVKALFPSTSGVSVGTDVRVAGIKVGEVTGQRLDPESYQAELTLALNRKLPVPSDSSASIASEGLLGGSHIQLTPGGSPTPLKSGDMIFDTQGAIDMMSLIGSFINRPSENGEGGTDAGGMGGEGNTAAPQ
jgi:phospholipid/cholesterol/gamma-HCH transport system substrate-binding protein